VLDGLPATAHRVRISVKPQLHGFDDMLVFQ
jgi:hypothetical protein